jgi:osmoprotectant transport system substrate-binding protein
VYATALERGGYDVARLGALGPREVVAPALEQGLVDLVPEYVGSALRFLDDAGPSDAARPPDLHAALAEALTGRGLQPLQLAPGQDQNGVVVTREAAAAGGLSTISDLRDVAATMTFGGPPECQERPLCLRGLQERYGLRFRSFLPFTSRAATAEALLAGQLDVGVLETVDAYLADGRLVLLADDRGLQPQENVVPVVRRAVVEEHGPRLVDLLDAVTATLTTQGMTQLNRQVVLDGRPLAGVAATWVERHDLGRPG